MFLWAIFHECRAVSAMQKLPGEQKADIDIASSREQSLSGFGRSERFMRSILWFLKKCRVPIKILTVITDPDEVKNILMHLIKPANHPQVLIRLIFG